MTTEPVSQDKIKAQETAQSMTRIVLSQFLEHKAAVVGAVLIFILSVVALSADWISALTGLNPNTQNVNARYLHPFSRSEMDSGSKENLTERWIAENPDAAREIISLIENQQLVPSTGEDALYELVLLERSEALQKASQIEHPGAESLRSLIDSFSRYHIFGTDEVGRDVFIRLVYASRVSLGVGILVAIASSLIGFLIGSFSGYYGGIVDMLLMRVTDALLSLPTIPILIVIAAIDLQKIPWLYSLIGGQHESIFKMVIILCLFSWMTVARLVRGAVLSLREREFILAAKTLGARDSVIIFRHLFPNAIAPMLVTTTLGVGESILFEAALSFLGLGITPPTASWGNMLNNAQELIYNNPWLAVLPGLMILITTISFNFVGDGLQAAVDPKSIQR